MTAIIYRGRAAFVLGLTSATALSGVPVAHAATMQAPPSPASGSSQPTEATVDEDGVPQAAPSPQTDGESQPATPDFQQDIVVTGYRRSIERANAAKRNAANFQDSILAEDIGKFPELNLAESLARISGVQISRENGEGRQVSLRGLGPNFTRVTLNGLPIAPQTSDSGSRAVDFDIFPSELFSRVTVDKSAKPSLLEGGLAGNIDLANAHPFDTTGLTIRYSLKGQYQEASEKIDPRGALVVSKNWGDTFGVLIGGAYSRRRYAENVYVTESWTRPRVDVNGNGKLDAAEVLNGGFQFAPLDPSGSAGVSAQALADSRFPRLPRPNPSVGQRERIGVIASVQYRPADTLTLSLDGFYNKLNESLDAVATGVAIRNSKALTPVGLTLDGNGTVVGGHLDNVEIYEPVNTQRYNTRFYQGVLSADWSPNDTLNVDGRVGYSKTKWNRYFSLFLFQTPPTAGVGIDFTIPDDGVSIPVITPDFNLADPSLYQLTTIRNQPYESSSEDLSGRLNMRVGSTDTNLRVGFAYDREKRYRQRRQANGAPTMFAPDFDQSEVPGLLQTASGNYLSQVDQSLGFSQWLVGDLRALDARFDIDAMQDAAPILESGTASTQETDISGYFEVNGLAQIFGRDLRANAGVRVTHTDQLVSSPFNGQLVSFKRSYIEPLPSLNLTYNLGTDLLLRFAAARAMTRPIPNDLEPTTTVDFSGNVTQNNPNLDPYFSDQFDVGLEWYFQRRGVLAADFFYKKITGFIQSTTRQGRFGDAGIALGTLDPAIQNGLVNGYETLVQFNTQENVNDPQAVKGAEFAYQQPLDFLLDGLGFLGNITYLDDSDAPRVTGLAKYSYNLVGYYERDALQLRLSYSHRGEYLTCAGPCTDGLPEKSYNEPQGYLDFSASYKLPIDLDVAFTVDAINLTNEAVRSYSGYANRLISYEKPGRTILVGVRGSF